MQLRVLDFVFNEKRKQWSSTRIVNGRQVVYVVDEFSRQPEAGQVWVAMLAPQPIVDNNETTVILCELALELPLSDLTFEAGKDEDGFRWQKEVLSDDVSIMLVVDRRSPRQPKSTTDRWKCVFHGITQHDDTSATVVLRLVERVATISKSEGKPATKPLGLTG